ncbi:MAG: chaperonin GroEL, partial [Simkaniaceae bacterium]|nr:chaperonin GroEL [Simkaniaceae bacterium]
MSKMLMFNEKALKAIYRGVKTLSKAVIITLGPRGRNVVINKGASTPLSTKDGVTVAKEIALKDKFENMGAQLVKQASSKTADIAGDGTTTAIVLAEAIFTQGLKNVIAGANPMSIKKGIEKGVESLVLKLDSLSHKISSKEEIKHIATISSNNDPEVGQMIVEAIEKVGNDGSITIADARGIESYLKVVEGMQFDKGYLSPYFVTNSENMSVEFNQGLIFVTDQKLSSANDIIPILEAAQKRGNQPLLIIAEDIESEALATLVVNKLKAGLSVCAVKAPGFGDRRKEILEDIAIVAGATAFTGEMGYQFKDIQPEMFGLAKTIKITKEETMIVDGQGNHAKIKKRADQIRHQMHITTSDYDREKLEERLAKVAGGVAVIHIGAPTEAELNERKARIEDALHSTRAAMREGVVPGGGVALIRASTALAALQLDEEQNIGIQILRKACFAPAIAIANNCGCQGEMIAEKIAEKEGDFGFNGLTGEFENLVEAGVIDPVLVTKSALKNAASIASILLTVAAMVTEKPEPKKPKVDAESMGGMH